MNEMQCQCLWSVDNCGIVHSLDIKTKQWSQLSYQRLEFKRLSSAPQSIWAIGGDHQIYIYLPASDIPIRVCALTYENQRWNPVTQFSSKILLPTDRPAFSCADGTLALPKDSFTLPSKSWQWESDWYVDNNIEGEPLEPEGWSYAIDFPMKFSSERRWNSMVRRRRWLRFRRYVAVNEWTLLESIHGDYVTEPFIDISTGGYEVHGTNNGVLAVWAVTIIGRVMYRTGIEKYSPEGVSWINVSVPTGWEVNQISCGPSGLVWAIAWDGSALVRTGINRDNVFGNNWIRVDAPNKSKLMQISVGMDGVWALTRDGKVWFRKGVRGLNSGHNDKCAVGSGWVEMLQEMSLLSVTTNDQVWALSPDKKCLYYRTGITYGELTGKSWKLVSQQPINYISQKIVNKGVEQQLDSISISSQDSCFSSLSDNQTQAWIWISAACCSLQIDSYFQFSQSSHDSQSSLDLSIGYTSDKNCEDCQWKSNILMQLNKRIEIEMKDFMSIYPKAIESGVWIKSGTCFVAKTTDKTSITWCSGLLELERQGVEKNTESGTLTITYSISHQKTKSEKIVLNLAEIVTSFIDSIDVTLYSPHNCLFIITNNAIIKLKFQTDNEMDDWLATINTVCADLHGISNSITTSLSGALLYCITNKGDLYVGYTISEDNIFYYLLSGGHFKSVCVCLDICWAISYENVLWIHNRGTGGGIYQTVTGANNNCNQMTDTMSYICYENQRWNPLTGFAAKGLPTDRYMWSDETGRYELLKDSMKLLSKHWQWISEWSIDYTVDNGAVDTEGWQYAIDFPFEYHSERRFTDYVRRRRWIRRSRLTTTGPFIDMSKTPIISASMYCSNFKSQSIGEVILNVWAVSADGHALCRLGVSRINPKGLSWEHVSCEQPLSDISVGGYGNFIQVWAIATDGSAFLRHGINRTSPAGTVWFHVEAPRPQCPLTQISIGKNGVWVIDGKHRLWMREEIVDTFPEGTHWKKVDDNVIKISVNNCDDFWAIIRCQQNESFVLRIAKRIGITSEVRMGTDWQIFNKHLNHMPNGRHTAIRVLILCLLWYITSAGNGVIGKLLLQSFPYPITVTIVQLLSITIYSLPALSLISRGKREPTLEWSYYVKIIIPLAFGKFFASVSSHISLWAVPVSYAHTVKASMPLFVVILSRVLLGEKQTTKVYLSLAPIVVGILIATITELEFNIIGLVSALFSIFVFSLQNIFSKQVMRETSLHHIRLLHVLARLALIMFIPIWFWHDFLDILYSESTTTLDGWIVALFLFIDGLANFLQNVIAFTVLSMVTPLTYSVCNASKRIAIITCSVIMLKNPVTPMNVLGMSFAIFGVFYYNKAKYDQMSEEKLKPILPYTKSDSNLLLKYANQSHHNIGFNYISNGSKTLQNGHTYHY
ncbi:tectonin beta-propeller repeat-containing protein 1-like [Oppia nitens]|uniref:tectonin beta-propeller repeat-containing protein 1-like n=1 Tax=Oppia nitens TaxID=1686743 RepID=UPI0023DC46E1|nr:tectonin beta-propeller repeat-containing protein 1-like [Oppia nitens]